MSSQYYPQQKPYSPPPPSNPEGEYYQEYEYDEAEEDEEVSSGDSCLVRGLIFTAGGCVTFLFMSFCGLLGIGLWILDPGSALLSSPIPGSDIGLAFEKPATAREAVVNDQSVRLTILQVNRNAESNTIAKQDGTEIVVVTVQLENLGSKDIDYDEERNFRLLNQNSGYYNLTAGAIGDGLGFGSLRPAEGTQGRLVFQVMTDEQGLVLEWDVGTGSKPRYIQLQ